MIHASFTFLVIGVALLALMATSDGKGLPKQSPQLAKQFIGQKERVYKREDEEEEEDDGSEEEEEEEDRSPSAGSPSAGPPGSGPAFTDCSPQYWSDWTIKTLDPCTQIRYIRVADICMPQERPCSMACEPLGPVSIEVTDTGVIEAPARIRNKRDVEWCPEEEWTVYGREDGCVALRNATWYKCLEGSCQNCSPPDGGSLLCVQDKYTILTVPLMCPDPPDSVVMMVVERPMACTCHEVINTCDKFKGPCA